MVHLTIDQRLERYGITKENNASEWSNWNRGIISLLVRHITCDDELLTLLEDAIEARRAEPRNIVDTLFYVSHKKEVGLRLVRLMDTNEWLQEMVNRNSDVYDRWCCGWAMPAFVFAVHSNGGATPTPTAFRRAVQCNKEDADNALAIVRWLTCTLQLTAPDDVVGYANSKHSLRILDWLHNTQWLPRGTASRYIHHPEAKHRACTGSFDKGALATWLHEHGVRFTLDDVIQGLSWCTRTAELSVLLRLVNDDGRRTANADGASRAQDLELASFLVDRRPSVVSQAAEKCDVEVNRWLVEHMRMPHDPMQCHTRAASRPHIHWHTAVLLYWQERCLFNKSDAL